MAEKTTPIIVVGASTTAMSCERLVHRAGYPVFAACELDAWPTRTRHYKALPASRGRVWRGQLGEAGYDALRALPFDECVLIPAADDAAMWQSALPSDLQTKVRVSSSSLHTLQLLQDKSEFPHLLQRLDVPAPGSYVVEKAEDFEKIPFESLEAVFLKPTDSQAFVQKYNRKAIWVNSRDQALHEWQSVGAAGLGLIVQEYVSGGADDHYFIDGFRDRDGVVRAKTARRRIRIYPQDFGNSSYCRSVPFDEVQPAWPGLERILADVDYRGIFSAEFKQDSRDGLFKILEINTRPWVYVEFADYCGMNMCELYIQDALGQEVTSLEHYTAGRDCVDFYNDLVAVVEMPKEKRPPLTELLRVWGAGFKLLFSWRDPGPALHFLRRTAGRKLSRYWRSLKRSEAAT